MIRLYKCCFVFVHLPTKHSALVNWDNLLIKEAAPKKQSKSVGNDMGVSKNRGTPKWMVYNIRENPIEMDDLGGKPTIFGNIHIVP